LAWTIVRPSGLFDAPAVSAYGVAIDFIAHRFTARIDLADCLLRQALGDTYVRSTIAVATPSAHPSILKLIWRVGIRKKPGTHEPDHAPPRRSGVHRPLGGAPATDPRSRLPHVAALPRRRGRGAGSVRPPGPNGHR